jgi:tRNA-intron endonuclease
VEATYDRDTDTVVVRNDARQQLYDASGYGEPLDGDKVSLTSVEATYLLRKGKLEDVDGDGYARFVRRAVEDEAVLRVYADLRDRGYYLSHDDELYLYARGDHPANASPETRVEAVDEDAVVEVGALPSLVAVADDDGDVTYFTVEEVVPDGGFPSLNSFEDTDVSIETDERGRWRAVILGEETLQEARYGAEDDKDDRGDRLVLSPVETAYLADRGFLDTQKTKVDARRLAVYADLRDRGVCPRTGFKFGADFRVYETPDDDHAGLLVSAVERDARLPVVELSRAVRLAHGVRKRMVFALVGEGDEHSNVEYIAVERERP